MSLWKRAGWWWCDFTVNGSRYRLPLETTDQREAKGLEKEKIAKATQGTLAAGNLAALARLSVDEAFARFLPQREAEIHIKRLSRGMEDPRTEAAYAKSESSHAKPLKAFFKGKRLRQLTAADLQAYQSHRMGEGKAAKTVNHETKLLLQLLKRAKLLGRIHDDVQLLPLNSEPRQMLTPAEKQRVFQTASMRPEWVTAYCAALLTANTSMRPVELRRLLWRDLDPENRLVTIRKSKTDGSSRIIPLNDEAWSAIAALKTRADKAQVYGLEYYIFHRQFPKIDPTQPMSNWRTAWRSLRKEAAKEDQDAGREAMPRLARLRYYDLRHQFVTELCEAGTPEGVIRELAGHVDPAMTRHYSHPRLAAKREAVELLSAVKASPQTGVSGGGYVTKHVTKALPAEILPAQDDLEAVSKIPVT
jgi:integrase